MTTTFEELIDELGRDFQKTRPKDSLQFCSNWFQHRLEEQRQTFLLSGYQQKGHFGTLDIPGNALLIPDSDRIRHSSFSHPPTSPLSAPTSLFSPSNPGDYLHPPTSAIFARRTSVSAESIAVDSSTDDPPPVYHKSQDQLRRIKASIANNFIFRDLDDEQESGVLSAMQEVTVAPGEVVIRQGDVGEYFYVVESGLLHCYIRTEPLPQTWLATNPGPVSDQPITTSDKFLQSAYHPDFGRKVAECRPGNSFGELALMYGHPRAATVLAIDPSVLWSLDRITFRTIILKAAHRRRTMYELFLSSVTLLSSLEPEERSKIADALVSKLYLDGESVVRQGEMGDTFFFVEEGEATVTKSQLGDDGQVKQITVGSLHKGDYFGGMRQFFYILVCTSSHFPLRTLSLAFGPSRCYRQCCAQVRSVLPQTQGRSTGCSRVYPSSWSSPRNHGTQSRREIRSQQSQDHPLSNFSRRL